jgi:tetratricopeptide (TPR) repeat protein
MKKAIVVVLVVATAAHALWANLQPDSLFLDANNQYDAKNYQQAIGSYLQLLSEGYQDDDVYYNLGNAYYRNGNSAQAIWCYEKSLLINGSNSDARTNLEFLSNTILGDQESVPENFFAYFWKSVYSVMSWRWWAFSVIACLVLTLALFLMFLLSNQIQRRRFFFVLTAFSTLLLLLSLAQSISGNYRLKNSRYAIVISEASNMKSSPDADGTSIAVLIPGVKVKITDSKSPWIEVLAPDGTTGWMIESDVLKLTTTIPSLQ